MISYRQADFQKFIENKTQKTRDEFKKNRDKEPLIIFGLFSDDKESNWHVEIISMMGLNSNLSNKLWFMLDNKIKNVNYNNSEDGVSAIKVALMNVVKRNGLELLEFKEIDKRFKKESLTYQAKIGIPS